jgi:hypothetical protein
MLRKYFGGLGLKRVFVWNFICEVFICWWFMTNYSPRWDKVLSFGFLWRLVAYASILTAGSMAAAAWRRRKKEKITFESLCLKSVFALHFLLCLLCQILILFFIIGEMARYSARPFAPGWGPVWYAPVALLFAAAMTAWIGVRKKATANKRPLRPRRPAVPRAR